MLSLEFSVLTPLCLIWFHTVLAISHMAVVEGLGLIWFSSVLSVGLLSSC